MKILVLSVGTRGDIDPVCALVQELLKDDDCGGSHGEERPKHSVDLVVQRNLMHLVRPLLTTRHAERSDGRRRLRLHEFPFSNKDFYSAIAKRKNDNEPSSTPAAPNCPRKREQHPDPRMKSLSHVADIISSLVLPCYDQVEAVLLKQDVNLIITASTMTRPLAFLLAKLYNISVIVLKLQPTVPNSVFPNYRVSTSDFVTAILKYSGQTCNKGNPDYEASYWKLEKALEDFFLGPLLERLATEKTNKDDASSSSEGDSGSCYFSWCDLERILSGQDANFFLVNAYSNHLVPSLEAHSKSYPHKRNIYDVGPLADAYLPPGSPSKALIRFLHQNNGDDDISDGGVRPRRRPIVCIGFGSMMFSNPKMLWRALQILNVRAVLVGSCLCWKDAKDMADDFIDDTAAKNQLDRANPVSNVPSPSSLITFLEANVHCVSSIPYAYLLPHCAVMFCHGGAGVVHACLRAGIPCVVAPVLGDQFAWGELLHARGLGLKLPRPLSDLTTQDVVDAIGTVLQDDTSDDHSGDNNGKHCIYSRNSGIRERCRILGETIRQEPEFGVRKLARLIDTIHVEKGG